MRLQTRCTGVAIAIVALTLAACGSPASPASPNPSAAPTRSAAPTATSKPDIFEPAAVSFISPRVGWVLGQGRCEACAALRVTRDGGEHWVALPVPNAVLGYYSTSADAVTNIAFANAADGYLDGPGLLVTSDGGTSWLRADLPPVQTLALGSHDAYVITKAPRTMTASLYRASIGSNRWTHLGLPGDTSHPVSYNTPSGQLLLYAEAGALVLMQPGITGPVNTPRSVGYIWVSTTDGTHWAARSVPCTSPRGGGADVLSIARGHPDAWLLDCFNNEQSSQEQNTQHILYGTANAGLSWVRLADPTTHNMPELLADNGSGHAFLATVGDRDYLVATFDGGLNWRTVIISGGSFSGWSDLGFVSSSVGFVVGPTHYAPEHLYRTQDGGRSWQVLRF